MVTARRGSFSVGPKCYVMSVLAEGLVEASSLLIDFKRFVLFFFKNLLVIGFLDLTQKWTRNGWLFQRAKASPRYSGWPLDLQHSSSATVL